MRTDLVCGTDVPRMNELTPFAVIADFRQDLDSPAHKTIDTIQIIDYSTFVTQMKRRDSARGTGVVASGGEYMIRISTV